MLVKPKKMGLNITFTFPQEKELFYEMLWDMTHIYHEEMSRWEDDPIENKAWHEKIGSGDFYEKKQEFLSLLNTLRSRE